MLILHHLFIKLNNKYSTNESVLAKSVVTGDYTHDLGHLFISSTNDLFLTKRINDNT